MPPIRMDDLKLVELVKQNRHLYDKSHTEYHDLAKKALTWKAIAAALGTTAENCRKRFRSLRDRFTKEKKVRNDEMLSDPTLPLVYKKMLFLWDHLSHRNSTDDTTEVKENDVREVQDEVVFIYDDTEQEEYDTPDDISAYVEIELNAPESDGEIDSGKSEKVSKESGVSEQQDEISGTPSKTENDQQKTDNIDSKRPNILLWSEMVPQETGKVDTEKTPREVSASEHETENDQQETNEMDTKGIEKALREVCASEHETETDQQETNEMEAEGTDSAPEQQNEVPGSCDETGNVQQETVLEKKADTPTKAQAVPKINISQQHNKMFRMFKLPINNIYTHNIHGHQNKRLKINNSYYQTKVTVTPPKQNKPNQSYYQTVETRTPLCKAAGTSNSSNEAFCVVIKQYLDKINRPDKLSATRLKILTTLHNELFSMHK